MAKKKYQSKKHHFKHTETKAPQATASASAVSGNASAVFESGKLAAQRSSGIVQAGARDFSYVSADLKRIMVMAGALVALELALWGLLEHTPVGAAVFRLVQV